MLSLSSPQLSLVTAACCSSLCGVLTLEVHSFDSPSHRTRVRVEIASQIQTRSFVTVGSCSSLLVHALSKSHHFLFVYFPFPVQATTVTRYFAGQQKKVTRSNIQLTNLVAATVEYTHYHLRTLVIASQSSRKHTRSRSRAQSILLDYNDR